jgi:hypothetical protein
VRGPVKRLPMRSWSRRGDGAGAGAAMRRRRRECTVQSSTWTVNEVLCHGVCAGDEAAARSLRSIWAPI